MDQVRPFRRLPTTAQNSPQQCSRCSLELYFLRFQIQSIEGLSRFCGGPCRCSSAATRTSWGPSAAAGGFCEANFRFRYYDCDQSKDCFEDGDTKSKETKVVEA